MRKAAITIDLDSIVCYQRIYGLDETPEDTRAYTLGAARFIEFCTRHQIPATMFAVASDLEVEENADVLKDAVRAGYEIGNHSYSHDYHLMLLDEEEMLHEVEDAKHLIEDKLGIEVRGFRAPGYNLNSNLISAVANANHEYDSSVFPCIPYYVAKAAAIAIINLKGKKSHSLPGDPRVLKAPIRPYKASLLNPYRKAKSYERSITEIPISTTALPFGRFPFLGSFISLAGKHGARLLYQALKMSNIPLVLEFHATDFMELNLDKLPAQLGAQPDLKIPLQEKLSIFSNVIEWMKKDFEFTTLADMARGIL